MTGLINLFSFFFFTNGNLQKKFKVNKPRKMHIHYTYNDKAYLCTYYIFKDIRNTVLILNMRIVYCTYGLLLFYIL